MKLIHLLPPAVALVIVGTWIGIQRLSISAMEHENDVLRKHIAEVGLADQGVAPTRAKSSSPDKLAKDKGPLNWKKLAGQFVEMQKSGGIGDMRETVHLQQRLQMMTAGDIAAAMDEIATLDLPAASHALLEQVLLPQLIQKNPELALTRFVDRLEEGTIGSLLAVALREWANKDVGKANAWFDQQITAGKFDNSKSLDGRSPSRMQFEATLIGVLLAADPASAARRLRAMPEDQRADVIGNYAVTSLNQTTQTVFAKLVREQVPEKDQARTFAGQAAQWVTQGGYAKVTEYMKQINATPVERTACIEQAIATTILPNDKKITHDDLDALRTWVATQAPGTTDSITGRVLCVAALRQGKLDFADAADFAVQYSQASGNDDVLVTFVENWALAGNKEQARALAARISDETRRAELLQRLE